MLKYRVITATILIIFTLAILFYLPPWLFTILTTLIALFAAWEWTNLMELKILLHRIVYIFLILLMLIGVSFLPISSILWITLVWWLCAIILIMCYPRGSSVWSKGVILRGLMGLFVLMPCWVAINFIRNQSDGIYVLLFLFILVYGADTVAYFIGKKWGKHKLVAKVSPGKSIEGLLGALIFSIIIAIVLLLIGQVPLNKWMWAIILSFITVLFSVIGDLFESMMKREAKLKDSGTLLPGHGGLLDRIDSLTAAAPIFVFGLVMAMSLS